MHRYTDGVFGIKTYQTEKEYDVRKRLAELLRNSPIPDDQLLNNIQLYINSKQTARMLFMQHIYKLSLPIMGVIMEFGTRWGPNAAQFAALRGVFEPFNRHRTIVAFDTFSGFEELSPEDGDSDMMTRGHLALPENYESYLDNVLSAIEGDNPLSHIKKFSIIKGDATKTLPEYLERNNHTIVSLAYFDFDVYEPTKACLEAIKPRLVKGSVVAFDEACDPDSPGETVALAEVFGLSNIRLERLPFCSRTSFFVVD